MQKSTATVSALAHAAPASGWAGLRGRLPVRRGRHAVRGLTLVEVLIVIALIAMLSGTIVFGSGMFASSREREAAMLIVSGVRVAITRANSTGNPVRMVFDIEHNRVMLEETTGPMLRTKDEGESTGAGADPATEAERKAQKESERILEAPHAARAHFTPVKQFGFDTDDPAKGRSLGKDIQFVQVQTEHDGEPRKDGRAYLYFWPGGGTERASIQIQRADKDKGLTIVVSPLTGRARIVGGLVELEDPRNDVDFGERKSAEDSP